MITLNSIEQLANRLAELLTKLKDENEQLKKKLTLSGKKCQKKIWSIYEK